ncbi:MULTISPECIES: sodium:solute symporter [Xanthomarina]|jgi:SSS family transporter|uniref:Sodium/iodide co-transporter n=1 Tax=Xanthomarina gelatinilytica TaxID=1137281 RepID=M7NAC0_9FLAO|nr:MULTISPECIES: sodium:solute symporter [Xanthomarina]EMQ95423.1 sodium/iodide co-transporter [Xanthomarina gelatinilytica]MBF60470.1 sodium:solute symporter [Xanthomarina sp.]MCB0388120.1 sodium:solute symporter [Winogradskyella sp.]MDX1317207.1 sodium:solute symporter [Xanthomarina gelatinilytica]|tara:strand:- start:1194 stop:2636 length:1443 start_codon:yes stop_codon:yes gene_type:complete
MNATQIILLILSYFGVLILISYFTGKTSGNDAFFKGNKQSPWFVVAFGMIGASLSGVTFISVPGWIEASQFSYMQVVLGYIVGYLVIGTVLLPLYYKLNLTSIYTYLEERFGNYSYKTGASFFLISRVVGASFRLFLVANVLQVILFDDIGIAFWQTVIITVLLIWLYTFKSGIKTIVWTDTLQTLFMLIAVGVTIYFVSGELGLDSGNILGFILDSDLSKTFFFDDFKSSNYFWKQFISGAFIAIVMTGLDQDMMQKNLTCKTLKDAQKNMFWFTIVLTVVNFIFLCLGLLLTVYAAQNGIDAHKDDLFPILAKNHLGIGVFVFFLIGLIAAAYSSADSALTALTTSFSIDILDIEKKLGPEAQIAKRKQIHVLFSIVLILVIVSFKYLIKDESVIAKLFVFAGYTYGPLLGLYAFGLFTKWQVKDKLVPVIAILSPVLSYIISVNSSKWFGFEFGFFILILNGLLTFLGLILIRRKQH